MKVTIFKFLLTLMFICIYQASTTLLVSADLIDDTCKKTDFPQLCASTLRSDPRSVSASVKQLADVVLEQTLIQANATLVQAEKLISQTIDPDVKKTLNSLDSEDYENAIEDAKAVGRDADGCEEAFTAAKVPSPLANNDKTLSQLSRIAEQIIALLV
ncbi:hypothetical protein Tsubulata_015386 [Turnera subulata]|uniref:Pectinesterase inhibitor domain-containing protein n=1 Tax=Turnera subulata TaxID=218843 RepID=A0A9Q0GFR4_9ROSI|nr:hypothetical protein Tsubulata_015386 [Turnera subulata]